MQREWQDLVARDGNAASQALPVSGADEEPDGEPPCPACGATAPLVDGACSDCGLQLA